MRSGNLYSKLVNAKGNVKGYGLRTLLLAGVLLLGMQAKAQSYTQVFNTSGASVVNGITVTVTSSGAASGPFFPCDAFTGPYLIGGGAGSYTFTFSAPVGSVEIPVLFGDGGPSFPGDVHFVVNGSDYFLTPGNLAGAYVTSCMAGTATASGGDLVNTGFESADPDNLIIIPGPITSITVSNVLADNAFFGILFTPMTYFKVSNTSGTSTVDGVTTTVTTSGGSSATACGTVGAPYFLTTGTQYNYSFSSAVSGVDVPLIYGDGGPSFPGTAHFGANGSAVSLTSSNINGLAYNTCLQGTAVASGGDLTNTGATSTDASADVMLPGPITTFSVSCTNSDNFYYGVYITAGSTAALSFNNSSPQSYSICENSGAASINSLLAVTDGNTGLPLTWTVVVPPLNGSIVTGGTQTSTGGGVTPTGFTYQPTPGFSGGDAFTMEVSDGVNTVTTIVIVTTNAQPTPTFTSMAGATTPVNGSVTYTTQAGQSNYIWSVPGTSGIDYTITSGGIGTGSNSVTLTWLTAGTKIVTVNYTNGTGCIGEGPAASTTAVGVYCTPGTSNGCSAHDQYSQFLTLGGVTNISQSPGDVCLGNAVGDSSFSGPGLSASATRGTAMNTSVTYNPSGFGPGEGFAVWIDWNQDNTFQASEQVYASASILAPGVNDIGSFSVPGGAVAGPTTLRIRSHYNNNGTTIDPCTFYPGSTDGYGISFDFPFTVLGVSFVNGNPQPFTICKNASAASINSLLTIEDPTAGLTETWTVLSAPIHGTLAGFPATATSTGVHVTPSGLTYVPTGGYAGSDAFVIQVSDGSATATTTVNVTVSAPNVTTLTLSESSVCPGTGAVVTVNPSSLTDGTYTVNYTLSGATSASGSATMTTTGGVGTFTTSALLSGSNTVTINSIVNASGCSSATSSTATATTIPVPNPLAVTGGGNYCIGGAGVDVFLAAPTQVGVNYQLFANGIATGAAQPGTTAGLTFGPETTTGTYTIIATNTFTGCTNAMCCPGSVSVGTNPLPSQFAVTVPNGGHYCAGGGGVIISLPGSVSGDVYQLYRGVTPIVPTVGGTTGFGISFAAQTTAGTYTVHSTTSATGCTDTMLNSVPVIIDPLPTATYSITATNGGHYCSGGSGSTIGLAMTDAGITYQLFRGATLVSTASGTGSAVSFSPAQTIGGTYTVTATNATTTCTVNMAGSVTVVVDPLPAAIASATTFSVCQNATINLNDATGGGTWTSSSTGVATIGSGSGIVTGVTPGNTTITFTVTSSGCTATAIVTVNSIPTPISGGSGVCVGSSISLTSTPSGGTWSSSATGLATVGSASGVVTGASAGLPTISYTLPVTGCFATTPVTVNGLPAVITSANTSVCVGSTISVSDATSGGTWSSSNTGQATVGSGSGVVGGVGSGVPNITYTISTGCYVIYPVTVNPLPNSISGTLTVCQGSTTPLSDASGSGAWSSSNTAAATVGTSGVVSGVAPGNSTITFTLPTGCSATAIVTVNALPPAITGAGAVCIGATLGLSDPTSGGIWSSGNNAQATVGSTSGIVTGVTAGTPAITYTLLGCTAATNVTVSSATAAIGGIASVCVGLTTSLNDATPGGVWASSNTSTATVGTSGTVGGVAPGTSVITYTPPSGCPVTVTVTVNSLPAGITGLSSACIGSTIGLSDATAGGAWSSSDNSEATVGTGSGVVTGVTLGTPVITYTLLTGCIATLPITVNSLPASITASPAASVCAGLTTLLIDGTSGGTWSSSNTALATVGTGGIAGGVSQGTPTITYTLPTGCIATIPFTVNPLPAAIGGLTAVCTGAAIGLSDASAGGVWSSSDGTQATVGSTSGVVTGLSAPTTPNITYTLPTGCIATLPITVNETPLAITSGAPTVCVGLTTTLTDGTPGGAWSSSNTAEALVGISGIVTGVTPGTPTITYTMGTGCFTTFIVTVNPNPAAITGSNTVCSGSTVGLADATPGGNWSSSNNAQATVGTSSGVVTGVTAPTNPTITYTLPTGCIATLPMTVNPAPAVITGSPSVCIGSTTPLADGTPGGAWSSSNTALATVGITGIAGGVATGTPVITYTLGTGCFITTTETVNPLPSAISGPASVCAGSSITLSDLGGGTWSSTANATVGSATGIVTGVTPGPATITYTLPTTCTTTLVITVNTQPSPITAGSGTVCVGSTTSLTDPTPGGIWSSSNTALATVGTSGTAGGVAAGTANITYNLPPGCFVTTAETVNPLPLAISGPGSVCAGSSITLTDLGGGTWSSTANATAGSSSGVVTGINPGTIPVTATITYTLPTGCTTTTVITVNPQPVAITGTMTVCTGLTTALSDGTAGGAWSSSNTALATVGTSGTVVGVAAGTPAITYTLPTGCFSTATVTVNSSPAPITGILSACVGLTTALGDATTGGTWTSSNTAQATVGSSTGVVTGVGAGNPNVVYTVPNGCLVSANLTVNPTPAAIGGIFTVCAGSSTVLSDGVSGGTWSSSNTAVATVGTGGAVTGAAGGTATIIYTLGAGCTASVIVTVNPIPNISSFTSPTATNACTGSSSTVTVNSTSLGTGTFTVTYNLSAPNTATGLTATLTMGPTNGTFTIPPGAVVNTGVTTLTITSISNGFGCSSTVSSSNTATLTTFPLPTVFVVGGGGGYCAGGTGSHVTLSGSLGGNTYQLYNGATTVGGPVTGTFSGLDFGPQTAVGTYSVTATNTTTGCSVAMSGSVTVSVNPLPTAFAISGGGGYCFGGSGVLIGVGGSQAGINYQLYNGGSTVGGTVAGTGSPVSFGLQTAAGVYTVVATNPATGCTQTMTGTATVVINPVPSSISGTTSVCPGTTVTLGSAPSGGAWSSSTSSVATVGSNTGVVSGVAAGTTTITYTLATGCFTSATVTVNPLPSAITGTPNVCTGLTTTLSDPTGGGTWSSGNTLIANINISSGLVSGIAPGTTTMTYTLATGCTATASFTVNPTPVAIAGPSTVCVGSAITLTDATTGGTWSSSSTTLATVGSASGVVTGASSPGSPTITYTLPAGCTATAVITVNPTPAGITGSNNVCTGVTSALADATGGGVWSSSNSALATVNSASGAVTGIAAGTPAITYTLPAGCTALYPVTVNISPAAISGATTVCAGLTTTLSDATSGGTWSSSSTSLATVGTGTGVVSGLSAGTLTIIYTMPTTCTATASFTVNPTPVATGGVNTVCAGLTTNLTDGTAGGAWSSSNTALATVGSTGTVGGVAAGTPTITYTLPAGCFTTTQITVNPTPAAITGTNNICSGAATALSDVTTGGVWTSSNTSVGSVGSSSGIVTGGVSGTLSIIYTLPAGCTAAFPMTVNALPAGITGTANVCVASVTNLGDATAGGVWSSSNTSLAIVGAAGAVTGVAAGTPVISYTLATGCSATTLVTVNPLPLAITGILSVCTASTTNLTDASSGGTWMSGTPSIATIGSTGIVSGLITGNSLITYTLPTGCVATATVTVNQTPSPIAGSNNVCVGQITPLTDPSGGGTWSSSNTLLATVGSAGAVTGVAAGSPVITYTLPGGCFVTFSVTVNPTPANITGTASACTGTTSTLADATVGGVWSSSNTTMATVGSITGIVSALTPGTPTVTYTLPAGCTATVAFTVNLTPVAITGVTNTCIGTASTLTDGSAGGAWSSGNTALATVGTGGAVTGVAAGTVAITYTLSAGSCFATTPFTVNPLPTAITGTKNVCVGNTTSLASTPSGGTWSSSNTTFAIVGSGTGVVTGQAAGVPTITYTIPTACIVTTPVTVNPLPATFTVTGGGGYCVGGTGFHINLSGSTSGITYNLMLTTPVSYTFVTSLTGTGGALDFGVQAAGGTYKVGATNSATGCGDTMSSSATILVNPLPAQFNITGGGAYCIGGTGALMGLNGSQAGVNYQLFNTTTSALVGSIVAGTGSAIGFGLITTAGTYIVVATNSVTSCTQNMLGTAVISITPLPTVFAVTGGGSYCATGTGVHIGTSGSQSGVNYQLLLTPSIVPVATLPGTGSTLDFGLITTAGTYTIVATGASFPACSSNLSGTAVVTINSLPTNTFTVTTPGGSSICAGGAGVLIGLSNSQAGISYQIFAGGLAVGSPATGLAAGAFSIATVAPAVTTTYSVIGTSALGCTSTMTGTATITVNPLATPQTVTGGGSLCLGGSGVAIGLANSVIGSTYTLIQPGGGACCATAGTGAAISFGTFTAAGIYTAIGAVTATATCTVNMSGSVIVNVNPLPSNAFSVTGGGSYCTGGTGLHVGLSGSATGVSYQLYNTGVPVGLAVLGTGGSLDFGVMTSAGTYTVMGTNVTTLCTNGMSGAATITITLPPAAYIVSGGGSYCAGGAGLHVTLNNSATGVTYQLLNSGSPTGLPVAGLTGTPIDFGLQTAAGSYTVFATNPSTTCTNTMSGSASIIINSLPAVNNVLGGGSYCSGGIGVDVSLNGSVIGNTYQLNKSGAAMGVPLPGTGLALDYGLMTDSGTYTVTALTTATGCSGNMSGSATVTILPLPALFNVTGGGGYCVGSAGVHIGLSGSGIGITYQLMYGSGLLGLPVAGTGSALDFGVVTGAGTYTVVATNFFTGCSATMSGSATVSINAVPNVYAVTGGGSYCPGGSGVLVGLTPSDIGISYQLFIGGSTEVGAPVAGTGGSITFGSETGAGAYSVVATNTVTGCTSNMAGTVSVATYPLPTAYTVTGGGTYCTGGAGVPVGLGNSATGVNYQLYNGVTPVGLAMAGTGFSLNFGNQPNGVYTVKATSAATGCTNNMTGSVTVTVVPLPAVHSVTGGGSYCAGGPGVDIGMAASDTGVNYQLMRGGTAVGGPVAGSGTTLDLGVQTIAGVYTVVATNAATSCVINMAGSATVSISALPAPYIVAGGGSYCAGSGGVAVTMDGSDVGINYQLYNGVSAVGGTVAGTSFPINFGLQTAAGTYTVKATNAATGCMVTMPDSAIVTVNPTPLVYAVSGGGTFCPDVTTGIHIDLSGSDTGINYQLYNGSLGVGTPVPGTGAFLDYSFTSVVPGSYRIVATNSATACVSNMSDTVTIAAYPVPVAYTVTGGGAYCSGGTGVVVGLISSSTGFHYQLHNGVSPVGLAVAGTGLDINFGLQTAAGTYTVIASNDTTGCTKLMTGSAIVSITPLPAVYTLTSSAASYCFGSIGVDISLGGSQTGVNYQLLNSSTPVGIPVAGTGAAIDFGNQPVGTYSVMAQNAVTSCTNTMSGVLVITINPLPTVYNVTGGGGYCAGGTGVHVYIDGSDVGTNYQLMNGVIAVGAAVPGTGAGIDFGAYTASGAYTVVATNTATPCSDNMAGNATITINPLPTAYAVTGGGGFCEGGVGVHVGLGGSDTGVNYQLFRGGVSVSGEVAGTGAGIDFGLQPGTGVYTVVATNATTGCTHNMTGSVTVAVNPLPTAYTVTGGGNYCTGGTGVHIGTSSSDTGVTYQLQRSGVDIGPALAGTGSALDFGLETVAGSYIVVATNVTTGCTANMAGSAAITISSLPGVFTVTGGGHYCASTTGVPVGLSGSELGVNYQLFDGASALGGAVPGVIGGGTITFGMHTFGTYTVVATNATTGCTSNMTGSVTVTLDSSVTPSVSINTGVGDTVCAGTLTTFVALTGNGGLSPTFQWFVNGSPVSTAGGSYSYVPTNGNVVTVTMTSDAMCAAPATVSGTLTMTVRPYVTPAVSITATPGDSVCQGTTVNFIAAPVFGGTAPTYSWLRNGIPAGGGDTFSYMPSDGDVIFVNMTSNYLCSSVPTAISNNIALVVEPSAPPVVSVTVNYGTDLNGVVYNDTLTATVTGGFAPTYQWSVNGVDIPGANLSTYMSYSLFNNDVVICTVTNHSICGAIPASNSITIIAVNNVGVKTVTSLNSDIMLVPNPNKGDFTVKGTLGTTTDEEVTLEITDMLGQVIYKGKVMTHNGTINERIQLDNTVANGMYLLNLNSTSGGNKVFHMVIEQ